MSPRPHPHLVAAAAAAAPLLRQHADQAERQRGLHPEVVRALRDAGVFRMWVPAALGGAELDYPSGLQVIEELARHDAAAAWVVFVAAGGAPLMSRLSDDAAQAIQGDADAIVCGSFYPPGAAAPAAGGHRIRGRWSYVSGCAHATWLALSAMAAPEGGGAPRLHMFLVPAAQAQVQDTWHTGGLRATGSHDVTVADAFVPHGWSFPVSGADAPRSRFHPGPLYRFPAYGFLGTPAAAVALGTARAALDALLALAHGKVPTGRSSTLAGQQTAQVAVAKARAQVAAAAAWLQQLAGELWQRVERQQPLPADAAAQLMLASTHATWAAAGAVDLVQATAGATAVYTACPIERAFRDIHTITQHRRVAQISFETVGRTMFGLDGNDPVLGF